MSARPVRLEVADYLPFERDVKPGSDARRELVTANAAAEAGNVDPRCNILGGVNTRDECQAYVDETKSELDAAERKDIIGYIGIGLSTALAVTGVVFALTGEDADKFGAAPSSSTASRPRWTLAARPGDVGLGVSAAFEPLCLARMAFPPWSNSDRDAQSC